ncbi:unnamed protein product, partial [Closterium sp. NIES-54]
DQGVDQFTPASQRVTHCTCARTGRHLATFTHRLGLSLYTLSSESPPVTASGQAAASSQVFAAASRSGPECAPCSCRLLSHQTLLWHHHLGHPSLPRLRGMASRVLLSGLPRSLPPIPLGPAPTCVPCVEGRQRAAPHSYEFPPIEAPLQTLHMDVWGPARVRGQGHERYFLLVVDDYSRYTTVFPSRSKGDVTEVLIDWIRAARLQLRESFGSDFPVLRLHSDRGGEFSSACLGAFCHAQGIRQTFTLPASPQQNGIAERRIGLVMDVARTSMIHAAAPHFLWPFAVQYAAHQLNLQPRVSLPKTSPTLWWTGKVGDASAFRVWGSRAFVRDLSADKLSPRAVPCVFLGFPTDAPMWQFYHPTSRRVLSSQDVTFDESVPYYRLFPYRTAPLPPPPLFLAPGPPPVDPVPPKGPAPSGVSQVDAVKPVEVTVDSGAARGAEPGGAESGGAEPGGAASGGAESGGAEPGGAEPGGADRAAGAGGPPVTTGPGGARTGGIGAVGTGGVAAATGVSPAGASGAAGAGAAGGVDAGVGAAGASGAAGAGAAGGVDAGVGAAGASVAAGAGAAGGTRAAGPAGVGTVGAWGAAGTGATTGVTGAVPVGSGGPTWPRPYFVLLLEQVLGLPPSPGPAPPLECPQPVLSQSSLQPVSPRPAPSPYTGPTGGLAERREPASRPASPVCTTRTSRRALRPRPPAVPGTHQMALRPSTAPLRVPLPSPPESSLPFLADPESVSLRAASPTVARLLSTVVTDPSFESTVASALVAELVDFAACCRLDYATRLVAESESACPPSVGGECALSTDVLEDRREEFQCFAAALPHLSAMDAEMASWKSTGTYVDEASPLGANIVSGMWIFRVKRPPGSPPVVKARYVARGFSQRQGVDYFQTFSPTPKMTTLRVLLHVAAQRDYELHSLDFSTAFLQGSLHEEIWLRRPPGFTRSFPPGTQWSLRRRVYGLCQAPREWHDTLRTTLAALGFAPSTTDPSLFLRTDTSLPPLYILVYVDDLVFAIADTAGLAHVKSEPQKRHTCTDLGELRGYLGLQITRDRAQRTVTLTQSHMVQQVLQRFDFTYSSPQATPLSTHHSLSALPSDESVEPSGPYPELVGCLMVLRYLCSTSGMGLVLGGRRPVVLTGHADASWADDQATQRSSQGYTFSLGSGSVSWRSTRSSSVLGSSFLYVGNKAVLALCREHRLEHRTKHIALHYFLARELQQRGQLRLAYIASEANTADIFTKALPPGDHQRFCTMLGFPTSEPRRPLCPTACAATAATAVTAATTAPTAAMAKPTVLTYDAEGRAVDFDVWVDDLQLFLQCDSRDGWTTRGADARLAVRSHLPPAERAHFGQYKTAQSLYDAVVARYSSPATAALSRLMLPYFFPDLAAFATVADLVANLRTSDARYRAALLTEFCAKNPPPMYITLYYLVLLAATFAPPSLRGVPLSPFSPLLPLLLLSTLLALRRSELRLPLVGDVATARARGARVAEGAAGEAVEEVEEVEGVAVEVGVLLGVGASLAAVEVVEAAVEVVEAAAAVVEVAVAVVLVEVQPRSVEALVVASASSSRAPVRPRRPSSFVSCTLGMGGLGNVPIFDLDFDAILADMYALSDSAEGHCYLSVPPDLGIAAADLGASASAAPGIGEFAAPGAGESALSGTAPIEALHTFTLDSGASCSFFRDSTTLTPLSRLVAVSLTDPFGGPVLAHSSTVLPCPAAPSGLLSGLHLPSFSTNLVSGADLQDAWVDQFTPGAQLVAASSQVFAAVSRSSPASAPCSCRPLSHETLLWHHRLGHPSLPRLRGMASRTLVSGLPRSLPPLPLGPAPTCVPCVEGRQRATPHSSTFPPTEAPLQTLHMDVWGPARVRGQGHERYFLLVVDDYSRYTTVFPLRSKGEVPEVLIDWIRGTRRQLSESFGSDLPVLRLHSDRGGEFSSDLLRAFCRSESIRQTFTLSASPQQNGIAERRIGMVMDIAQTTPTLRWIGKVGDASAFRVWGSRAFVRDTSADKLSSHAVPCVFLGFPPDAPGWQFYHPTSHRVLSSQDVTFDESVSCYRLFPYCTASLPPPPLFLAPGTPPVYPLPPQGPAPSGVSQGDPAEPVEVAADSGGARGPEPAGAGTGGAEPERVELRGAKSGGSKSGRAEPGGAEPGSVEPARTTFGGVEPARAEPGGALGVPSRREPLSPQRLRDWYYRHCRGATGATGTSAAGVAGVDTGAAGGAAGGAARATGGAAGAASAGAAGATRGAAGAGAVEAAGGATGAGAAGGAAGASGGAVGARGAAGAGAARAAGGAAGTGGTAGVVAGDSGAEGTGAVSAVSRGAAQPPPYYVPLLQQVLGPPPPLLSPPPVHSQS